MATRRWDDDERGRGVGHARRLITPLDELVALAGEDGWVAEEPETHLLPGLRRRIELSGLTLEEAKAESDGSFRVRLSSSTKLSRREIRESVWSILGGAVELTTYVREVQSDGMVRFEVVTGIPPGGRFTTHGHTISVEVSQP
jgi:hypothetical protein